MNDQSFFRSRSNSNIMNQNRILRALNVLFICCGYQVQWFSVEVRKFQLNVVASINSIILAFCYAACFRQHFLDSSVFSLLIIIAPVLHKIIRLHLFLGLKAWLLIIFEMKHVTKALNEVIKYLPNPKYLSWSRNELTAYIWLFFGLIINFGFGLYIMVEMEFHLPTSDQIMHASALFLPHFALGCSCKVLNVASLLSKFELQSIRSKTNEIIKKEKHQNKALEPVRNNDLNSVELSATSTKPSDTEHKMIEFETLQLLVKRLEGLAVATEAINRSIQKQILFLFVMNSISLLGASYILVYYKTKWQQILEGPIGNSLYVFNIGVFVFIFWEYFSICVVNYLLEMEKSAFLKDVIKVLRSKSPLEEDIMLVLKDIKYSLKHNFRMHILFNAPITWQTLFMVNTLIGITIAIFMSFRYLDDNIENLESQLDFDED